MKKLRRLSKVVAFIFLLSVISASALDNMPTSKVDVGVAATEIVPANYSRKDIILQNIGAATVYIDNFAVDCSTTTSFDLLSGASITLKDYQGSLFGIVETSTSTIKVLELQY